MILKAVSHRSRKTSNNVERITVKGLNQGESMLWFE